MLGLTWQATESLLSTKSALEFEKAKSWLPKKRVFKPFSQDSLIFSGPRDGFELGLQALAADRKGWRAPTFADLQQRDCRWCIGDFVDKHERIRTAPKRARAGGTNPYLAFSGRRT